METQDLISTLNIKELDSKGGEHKSTVLATVVSRSNESQLPGTRKLQIRVATILDASESLNNKGFEYLDIAEQLLSEDGQDTGIWMPVDGIDIIDEDLAKLISIYDRLKELRENGELANLSLDMTIVESPFRGIAAVV